LFKGVYTIYYYPGIPYIAYSPILLGDIVLRFSYRLLRYEANFTRSLSIV
jgi:hypothetical protein